MQKKRNMMVSTSRSSIKWTNRLCKSTLRYNRPLFFFHVKIGPKMIKYMIIRGKLNIQFDGYNGKATQHRKLTSTCNEEVYWGLRTGDKFVFTPGDLSREQLPVWGPLKTKGSQVQRGECSGSDDTWRRHLDGRDGDRLVVEVGFGGAVMDPLPLLCDRGSAHPYAKHTIAYWRVISFHFFGGHCFFKTVQTLWMQNMQMRMQMRMQNIQLGDEWIQRVDQFPLFLGDSHFLKPFRHFDCLWHFIQNNYKKGQMFMWTVIIRKSQVWMYLRRNWELHHKMQNKNARWAIWTAPPPPNDIPLWMNPSVLMNSPP